MHSLQTWKSRHHFSQLVIDIMGTLPESGLLEYLLLNGYQFAKSYEVVSLENQEAKTVAKALFDIWVTKTENAVLTKGLVEKMKNQFSL